MASTKIKRCKLFPGSQIYFQCKGSSRDGSSGGAAAAASADELDRRSQFSSQMAFLHCRGIALSQFIPTADIILKLPEDHEDLELNSNAK